MRFVTAFGATIFASWQCSHDTVNVAPQWEMQFDLTSAISASWITAVHSGGKRDPISPETMGYGQAERPLAGALS